jgi:hypothetical protein
MNIINKASRLLSIGCCLAAAAGGAQADTPPEVPVNIRAPAAERIVLRAHASGAQIYLCQAGADGKLQWTLKAPEAELRNDHGVLIGKHYAGPTWKHQDGSEVIGKVVTRADSPDSASIPWLLLTAASHNGEGALTHVTSIQRIHTHGGQTPAASCDASHAGTEARSPYTADYVFYATGGDPR